MNNFLFSSFYSSSLSGDDNDNNYDDDDGDHDLFIYTFMLMTNKMLCQEARSSNVEKRTRTSINRDNIMENDFLVRDYFALDCLYN